MPTTDFAITTEVKSKIIGYNPIVHKRVSQIVRKTAFDIESWAKSLAAVDTGAMRASIYVVTSTSSGYSAAIGKAQSRSLKHRGDVGEYFNDIDMPKSDQEAWIVVGVFYAFFIEYGTVNMGARPFFYPAVLRATRSFQEALRKTLKEAADQAPWTLIKSA